MRTQREFICVICPVGCTIEAIVEGNELVGISGQACKRGVVFVQEELTAPRRVLTTTVRVRGGALPLVPVRSSEPLPKELLVQVVEALRQVSLEAPVSEHQIVIGNVLDTGVDVVTSRALWPADPRG